MERMSILDWLERPYQVPDVQRYWVVRADSGQFFSHFREAECIAIGHIDKLELKEDLDNPFSPDFDGLTENLKKYNEADNIGKAQFTSIINQVDKFVNEMESGDLVVTPDFANNRLMVGRITGLPRIDRTPIFLADARTGAESLMQLGLRRRVVWGDTIRRHSFPQDLLRSLRANQTVFNIDEHWEALHHILFPVFEYDGSVYVSFLIGQNDDIDNLSVSRFFSFLSEAELFASMVSGIDSIPQGEFFGLLIEAARTRQLSMTVKAQFMSNGHVNGSFSALGALGKRGAMLYLLSGILFGNHVTGFDGIIDLETRHKLRDFIIDYWENRGGDYVKSNLKLTMPNTNVKMITEGDGDEKRPNLVVGGAQLIRE